MSVGGGPIAGVGKVPMWGHSPATDLLKLVFDEDPIQSQEKRTYRILLVGQSDMRHVLETVTRNWDHLQQDEINIEFYIAEDFVELIGREMLLLFLAIQHYSLIGLEEKTLQFIELFGNGLIRPKTHNTLLDLSEKLIGIMTNSSETSLFDISDLKYREKDDLVEIFRHWRNFGDSSIFSIKDIWRMRVEKHLGVRYDARGNIFDWDYNMRLMDKGPSVISASEYKNWRETGIAFSQFDADYSQPNLTMATGIGSEGVVLGYRGEIVTGPFIPFGIEADDASFFKKINGQNASNAYAVTQYNVQRILRTLQSSTKPLNQLFKVYFFSPSTFGTPKFFNKFGNTLFDVAFFSTSSAQYVLPLIIRLIRPNAPVLVENTTYLLEVRLEQSKLYQGKVLELGKYSDLDFVDGKDEKSCVLKFKKKKGCTVELEKVEESGGDVPVVKGDESAAEASLKVSGLKI